MLRLKDGLRFAFRTGLFFPIDCKRRFGQNSKRVASHFFNGCTAHLSMNEVMTALRTLQHPEKHHTHLKTKTDFHIYRAMQYPAWCRTEWSYWTSQLCYFWVSSTFFINCRISLSRRIRCSWFSASLSFGARAQILQAIAQNYFRASKDTGVGFIAATKTAVRDSCRLGFAILANALFDCWQQSRG
jgi:hypothetical protein